MKSLISLLFLFVLASCQNSNQEVIADIQESYKRNMSFTRMESSEKFSNLEFLYQINSVKGKPFYLIGVSIREMVDKFHQKADSIYELDKIGVDDLTCLEQLNTTITDSIQCIVPGKWKDRLELISTDYSNKKYYESNPRLVILLMQNDLIKNEAYFMEYILSMISVGCFSFHQIEIQVNTIASPNSKRSHYLSEEYLQLEQKRIVQVDTVLRNNKIFLSQPKIEPDYKFAAITFDSLPKGSYKVKGRVKIVRDHIHDKEESFSYEFDVE